MARQVRNSYKIDCAVGVVRCHKFLYRPTLIARYDGYVQTPLGIVVVCSDWHKEYGVSYFRMIVGGRLIMIQDKRPRNEVALAREAHRLIKQEYHAWEYNELG